MRSLSISTSPGSATSPKSRTVILPTHLAAVHFRLGRWANSFASRSLCFHRLRKGFERKRTAATAREHKSAKTGLAWPSNRACFKRRAWTRISAFARCGQVVRETPSPVTAHFVASAPSRDTSSVDGPDPFPEGLLLPRLVLHNQATADFGCPTAHLDRWRIEVKGPKIDDNGS